jgi:hypothetical protein
LKRFRSVPVALPPLEEQGALVATVDEWLNRVENIRESTVANQERVQSRSNSQSS